MLKYFSFACSDSSVLPSSIGTSAFGVRSSRLNVTTSLGVLPVFLFETRFGINTFLAGDFAVEEASNLDDEPVIL